MNPFMQRGNVVDACACIEYIWNDTQETNAGCLWGVWGLWWEVTYLHGLNFIT